MKAKLLTPDALAAYNPRQNGAENAAQLMMTEQWEDALASVVADSPQEKLLAWTLQQALNQPGSAEQPVQQCASEIRQWLAEHDDARRFRIFQQAEQLGFDTPVGALGLAVFWMDGSMTPAEFDAVYPEAHLSRLMLLCALKLLSVGIAAENAPLTGAQTLLAQWHAVQGGH
ncbi:hypothetical protein EDF78_10160 [Rahnella sp. BIGb0236]|uniref:DUF6931 family protein n=1 Tax=Rahnella sp. BIGb0236 TaxID=2485117 RepID=UPI00105F43E0|nr:hypothetical protein [Rahnella sp. BIGb0236]TDS97685.1 hypothetical protein EDF78_10160 [Rahnella sp. BIGb0236]